MSLIDNIKVVLAKLNASVQKDERWVVSEFAKGWDLLRTVGHTVDVDIHNIAAWIQSHQASIVATLKVAELAAMRVSGVIAPQLTPLIAAATAAIDIGTAEVDTLTKQILAGKVTLSTAQTAYHSLKDAQTAVNAVLKQATAKPAA